MRSPSPAASARSARSSSSSSSLRSPRVAPAGTPIDSSASPLSSLSAASATAGIQQLGTSPSSSLSARRPQSFSAGGGAAAGDKAPKTPLSPTLLGHQRKPSIDDLSSGGSGAHLLSPTSSYRDWTRVPLTELVQKENLVVVEEELPVDQAFEVLASHGLTSVPVKPSASSLQVSGTFDYSDVNAYLLLVLGHLAIPEESQTDEIKQFIKQARSGRSVPIRFVCQLGAKNPFITLPLSSDLLKAVEILGSGVHRIAITSHQEKDDVVGVLSQRRVVRFFWDNLRAFPSLDGLLNSTLEQLKIGSSDHVISIHGDAPLIEALELMHAENVSSLAVVDSHKNLLGNISIVDVRLVSKVSRSSMLAKPCKQFLSYILSNRGLDDGKDSFPVFHVSKQTSLVRVIAKLVATKAHRLWVVAPPTDDNQLSSGLLTGVVSLTDVLSLFTKHSGIASDPTTARSRRRSSTSSIRSSSIGRSISRDRRPLN